MEDFVDHVKTWLKKHHKDRNWLGARTASNKRTVDNWLSAGKPIPAAKVTLIKQALADAETEAARRRQQLDPVAQVFSIEVDLPTFRAYSQAAKVHHLTIEEWAIAELNAAADEWLPLPPATARPIAKPADLALNEPPAAYGSIPLNVLMEDPTPLHPDELELVRQAQASEQTEQAPATSTGTPEDKSK